MGDNAVFKVTIDTSEESPNSEEDDKKGRTIIRSLREEGWSYMAIAKSLLDFENGKYKASRYIVEKICKGEDIPLKGRRRGHVKGKCLKTKKTDITSSFPRISQLIAV